MGDKKPSKANTSKTIIIVAIVVVAGILGCCFFCGGMTALTRIVSTEEGNSSSEEANTENDAQAEVTYPTEKEEEVKGISSQKYEYYKVTSVVDGDTLHIQIDGQDETVRLVGIDTPELSHPSKPVECFAQEAKDKLSELVLDKEVRFEYDSKQGKRDKYDRLLLYIWVDDIFVNDYMVREGYAYAYREIDSDCLEQFKKGEYEAKESEKGLWGDVCGCTKGEEESRSCSACNRATAYYYNWDCTTYSAEVDDASCSYLCPKEEEKEKKMAPVSPPVQTWACDCSKTCPQMSSCAEAQYQLNVCGCSARDGDKDGVACDVDCQ